MEKLTTLALAQINRRLKSIRKTAPETRVRQGWIRFMRESLGMTLKQLAARAGVALPTVSQAERNEVQGKMTIQTLKTMAEAMECELVYAFVPKAEIQEIKRAAAMKKVAGALAAADVHMTLENQKVDRAFEERVEILAEKLILKGDVW